ncbi:hypothetical protein UT300007_27720 [Clostridium sp. CTA-7]
MKFISKLISNLITIAYGIICMPLLILMAIIFPIKATSDAFKIITSGYTVTGDYISLLIGMTAIMYFSLRFRALRRIYMIFPSLFETIKYLLIASIFIGIGTEILNWSYISLTTSRKIIGICSFVGFIVIWRAVVSLYYKKKPLSKVMMQKEEKIQNYNTEIV